MISFTIYGPPVTKKTGNLLVHGKRRSWVLPKKAYQRWFENAMGQLPKIREKLYPDLRTRMLRREPITAPVHVRALFYLATRHKADLNGLQQALGDWLQMPGFRPKRNGAGIIYDDGQIISWDGSRALYDPENPRIEIEISIEIT